ncbi:hypothetical protein Purlil1_6555 [Purpureocillium lilacinum]|uniref:Secreted protein n=1 Tax=Purpureocillium lilacinum TaxID=33203 RepID=A0ABR0BYM4_PURLI|nr:hypothetical protein Purlil1_6555 [Purpureocillium lilacinum]
MLSVVVPPACLPSRVLASSDSPPGPLRARRVPFPPRSHKAPLKSLRPHNPLFNSFRAPVGYTAKSAWATAQTLARHLGSASRRSSGLTAAAVSSDFP